MEALDKVKRLVIVGGNSDIGKATIYKYLSEGYEIISFSRSGESSTNQRVKYFTGLDLTKEKDISDFTSKLKEIRPSCLVYLPGHIDNKLLEELKISDLIKTFSCNTFAYWLAIQACNQFMLEHRFGRFCSVSSIGSKFGGAMSRFSYTTSKSLLEYFPREFKELGKHNILVNNIICGVTNTKILHKKTEKVSSRSALIPQKRLAEPLEIAEQIFLLASDQNTFRHCSNTTVAGGE